MKGTVEVKEFEIKTFSILTTIICIANIIGFVINFTLHGWRVPTYICSLYSLIAIVVFLVAIKTERILTASYFLFVMLTYFEFPMVYFYYGRDALLYLLLGVICIMIATKHKARVMMGVITLAYYIAVIAFSAVYSYSFDSAVEIADLPELITEFLVAGSAAIAALTLFAKSNANKHREIDSLTGQYNRAGFVRKAGEIIRKNDDMDFAVLFFNLKGFKALNEICTQEGGDQVLKSFPIILKNSELKPLAIARLEADHFVCLIEADHFKPEYLDKICYAEYVFNNNKSFTINGKVGIFYVKDRKIDVGSMCDRAKLAEKFIEDEYANPYAVFEDTMSQNYISRAELIDRVKEAIDKKEFCVYYQPIYDAKTKEVVSAEALVRWISPIHGMVSPGLFIPVLEENGFISQVDLYVGTKVKEFLEYLYETNHRLVPISVNLSRMDFFDKKMIKKLLDGIRNSSMPGQFVRYEVTESAYTTLADSDNRTLSELHNMGISILLDDFGSGYSSFSAIREYKFDILKLDMGFISNLEKSERTRLIIRSIISMAHSIGMKVVAEGVENKNQYEYLVSHECDYIQGFYFSKPLPEKEFAKLLVKKDKQ